MQGTVAGWDFRDVGAEGKWPAEHLYEPINVNVNVYI